MSVRSLTWLLALLPAPVLAQSGDALQLLRPVSECLDPSRIRAWLQLDSDELLVDAGRRHFHLRFRHACGELNLNNDIEFRAGNGVGRICGSPGDVVLGPRPGWRGSACSIVEVIPISGERYQELSATRERRRAAASFGTAPRAR